MKVHCSLSQLRRSFPKAALVYKVSWESKSFVSTLPLERVAPCPWRENKGHGEITDTFWWFGPEVAHTSLPLVNPNMVPTWLQEQLGMQSQEGKEAWWAPDLISAMKYFCEGHRQCSTGAQLTRATGLNGGGSRFFVGKRCLCDGWRKWACSWFWGCSTVSPLVRKASSSRVTSCDQGAL